MPYTVSVKFGAGESYEINVHDRDVADSTPESARRWLGQQFNDMGCVPSNPTGKVLLVDKILGVARAIGDKPFARNESLAREFARNAVLAWEKRSVSIDLDDLTVR